MTAKIKEITLDESEDLIKAIFEEEYEKANMEVVKKFYDLIDELFGLFRIWIKNAGAKKIVFEDKPKVLKSLSTAFKPFKLSAFIYLSKRSNARKLAKTLRELADGLDSFPDAAFLFD
jgi:hypothetical protein